MCRKTSEPEDSVRACLQDVPSCALYAVFGIFPKSRYRQTCWVNSIQFSANNPTLAAALFSASAIKNGLDCVTGSATYAFARQGLQLPEADEEEERKEVLALGVCLQLSVAGAMMMEQWLGSSDSQEAVVKALKGLKERGVVTTSGGLHLLDKTIDIAQSEFSQELSTTEAWGILFES